MHLLCSHCDRSFTKTEHLKRHERTHTNDKPFTCDVCHKSYARSDVLARHARRHPAYQKKSSEKGSPAVSTGQVTPSGTPYQPNRQQNGASNPSQTNQTYAQNGNHSSYHPSSDMPGLQPDSKQLPFQASHIDAQPYSGFTPNANYEQVQQRTNGSHTALSGSAINTSGLPGLPIYGSNTTNEQTSYAQPTFSEDVPEYVAPAIQFSSFPYVPYEQQHQQQQQQQQLATPSHLNAITAPANSMAWLLQAQPPAESNIRSSSRAGGIHDGTVRTRYDQEEFSIPHGLTTTAAHSRQGSAETLLDFLMVSQQPENTAVQNILKFDNHLPGSPFPNLLIARHNKVEQTWFSRGPSQWSEFKTTPRWWDILHSMKGDMFNTESATCMESMHGLRPRVSEACRLRLIRALFPIVTNPYNPSWSGSIEQVPANVLNRFPSCEQFDRALDRYFASFLPEAPFLHMPLFSISTCQPLLLFVISTIGFWLGGDYEEREFVTGNFECLRVRVVSEIERKLTASIRDSMSIYATTFLFLKLAALIEDRDQLSPCQLLYISVVSLAQMQGLFSIHGKRAYEDMYNGCPSLRERWAAWGRVESLKRIAISLMRLDSAYACFVNSPPVIRIGQTEMLLPCDDRLFAAATPEAWFDLIQREGLSKVMPAITYKNSLQSLDSILMATRHNYYSLHSVLNYILLRHLTAYGRLRDFQMSEGSSVFVLVPFDFYRRDVGLHEMSSLVVAFMASFSSLFPRQSVAWQKTNCLVFWHYLCLTLAANQDLFEIASGRDGPQPVENALKNIKIWSTSSAARRAIIHAASIYKLISEGGDADKNSLYASFGIFLSALVIMMYVLADPISDSTHEPFELTDEIDWATVNLAGLDSSARPQTLSFAENFILKGGPCVFNGTSLRGFKGAQHVLLSYAQLLKKCGRYNFKSMYNNLIGISKSLERNPAAQS